MNLWQSRLRLFHKHYPRWKDDLARLMVGLGMGRKIRKAKGSHSLTAADRDALIQAYRAIRQMALRGIDLPK
jgi:hypothetical protein